MFAQGDMATLNSLVDATITEGADLLITLSTPTLQAALRRAAGKPIVFTYLANAVAAGAGRSDEDHLPNVVGVYNTAAYAEMLELIRQVRPDARLLGTLFVPAEVNMVYHREQLNEAARKFNFKVVAMAANTSADVADAALALTSQHIDVICQIPGNLTAAAFPSIASAANKAKLCKARRSIARAVIFICQVFRKAACTRLKLWKAAWWSHELWRCG